MYYCLSPKRVGYWLNASDSFQALQGPSLPLPFQLCSLLQTIPQRSSESHQRPGKAKQECVLRLQTIRLRIQRHQELVTQESSPEALGVEGAYLCPVTKHQMQTHWALSFCRQGDMGPHWDLTVSFQN